MCTAARSYSYAHFSRRRLKVSATALSYANHSLPPSIWPHWPSACSDQLVILVWDRLLDFCRQRPSLCHNTRSPAEPRGFGKRFRGGLLGCGRLVDADWRMPTGGRRLLLGRKASVFVKPPIHPQFGLSVTPEEFAFYRRL